MKNQAKLVKELILNNDVVSLNKILQNNKGSLSFFNSYSLIFAANKGYYEIVELLINDKRIDPTKTENAAIILSNNKEHTDIVEILFKDQRVQDSLKIDNIELYNKLFTKYLKNKIGKF